MVEVNELNKNARGGTELMQERLHKSIPEQLLNKFQIIPSRVRELDPDKKKILWLHDLPHDPESERSLLCLIGRCRCTISSAASPMLRAS
jgi:hypothetical protein